MWSIPHRSEDRGQRHAKDGPARDWLWKKAGPVRAVAGGARPERLSGSLGRMDREVHHAEGSLWFDPTLGGRDQL